MEASTSINRIENPKPKDTYEEEEESFVIYDEEDIAEGVKKCKYSIVGKLLTEKTINPSCVQNEILGHDEGTCEEAEEKEDGSKQKSKGLETWIRADTMGIRVSDSWENKGKARKEQDLKNMGETNKKSQQRMLNKLANLIVIDNRQYKQNTSNNKALTQVKTTKKDDGKENEKKEKELEKDKDIQTSQTPRQQNKEEIKEREKPKEEARNEGISIKEENTIEVQGKEEKKRWKRRARESENNSNKEEKMSTDAKRKLAEKVPMEIEEEEKKTKKHQSNPPTAVVAKQLYQDQ
ncbi:uncharacterized protein LOC130949333 [Arachis stenosperma]|uniref:uncharacterized protein LOC130949333 n=1 Tax=Arachis stenosperma TaxID=217475 RepID=UPI0025ABE962|nr:uncharacterized protein LOC130949333 [Arachis stenosperma]